VSHETIYQSLYVQTRGSLRADLYKCLSTKRAGRKPNENTNRLLRFWFHKGSDLSGHTKADLKRIQDTLNRRPRPTLNLDTPAQQLAQLLNQAA
jgi:transposase, IS30 family